MGGGGLPAGGERGRAELWLAPDGRDALLQPFDELQSGWTDAADSGVPARHGRLLDHGRLSVSGSDAGSRGDVYLWGLLVRADLGRAAESGSVERDASGGQGDEQHGV